MSQRPSSTRWLIAVILCFFVAGLLYLLFSSPQTQPPKKPADTVKPITIDIQKEIKENSERKRVSKPPSANTKSPVRNKPTPMKVSMIKKTLEDIFAIPLDKFTLNDFKDLVEDQQHPFKYEKKGSPEIGEYYEISTGSKQRKPPFFEGEINIHADNREELARFSMVYSYTKDNFSSLRKELSDHMKKKKIKIREQNLTFIMWQIGSYVLWISPEGDSTSNGAIKNIRITLEIDQG